jgi:hypothetical protein
MNIDGKSEVALQLQMPRFAAALVSPKKNVAFRLGK